MDLLFWIYLSNAVILIVHEIDSAYWQEWKLLDPKANEGINGFLILHIPMIFFLLLGLVYVYEQKNAGYLLSIFYSFGGLFAFFFHFYHLRKGRKEFNTVLSRSIIIAAFVLSVIQMALSMVRLIG